MRKTVFGCKLSHKMIRSLKFRILEVHGLSCSKNKDAGTLLSHMQKDRFSDESA